MADESLPDWRTCAADWYVAYREPVLGALTKAFPDTEPDLLYDAFVQGMLEIAMKPDAIDPERGTILNLLIGAARRALTTPLRSDTSRRRREQEKGLRLVAERTAAARDIVDRLADHELAPLIRAEIARTDEERRYLELWEQGIDDLEKQAAALGVGHLSPAEQRIEINRTHKRMMKRAERSPLGRSEEERRP
jgi:hypothetical protein